jgi:SET domain
MWGEYLNVSPEYLLIQLQGAIILVDKDLVIDVSKSPARFINHSHIPNCYIQKWDLNTRIALCSTRQIQAGEELVITYSGEIDFSCLCSQCRMASGLEREGEEPLG